MKSMNKKWRWLLGFASLIFVVVCLGFMGVEEWVYRTFPSTCPFSKYLPDDAVATQCEYSGLIEFDVQFQAQGSKIAFLTFVENLKLKWPNPVLDPRGSHFVGGIRIRAEPHTTVDMYWKDNIIVMDYRNF